MKTSIPACIFHDPKTQFSTYSPPWSTQKNCVWVKAWCNTANLGCSMWGKLFLVTWDCNDWLKHHTFSSSIHFSCWTSASLWKSSLTSSSERSAGRWDWGLLVLDCGKRNKTLLKHLNYLQICWKDHVLRMFQLLLSIQGSLTKKASKIFTKLM